MSGIIYCINPRCPRPENTDDLERCQTCNSSLLYSEFLYRAINPLGTQARRISEEQKDTRLYEVVDDEKNLEVMKVLTNNSDKLVKLFRREAEILQKLQRRRHPGIPWFDQYFTFVTSNDTELHCLVMEKIEGQNLKQWLEDKGNISQDIALNWLRQMVEILALVHQSEFIHQDIKPSNIMHKPDGQLVLIDFSDIPDIISAGYTPPEQANGNAVSQSDFFALGRTFVHLLTGIHPIDLSVTRRLIWRDKAPQVSQPLADLIDDLMAPSPSARPQNAKVIRERLEQIVNSLPTEPAVGERENPSYSPEQENIKPKARPNSNIIVIALLGLIIGISIGSWRKANRIIITFEEAETQKCKNGRNERFKEIHLSPSGYSEGELKYDENSKATHPAFKWGCRYETQVNKQSLIIQRGLNFNDMCIKKGLNNQNLLAEPVENYSKFFAIKCVTPY